MDIKALRRLRGDVLVRSSDARCSLMLTSNYILIYSIKPQPYCNSDYPIEYIPCSRFLREVIDG